MNKNRSKDFSDYKLIAVICGVIVLLFLFAFACYQFDIVLTDM